MARLSFFGEGFGFVGGIDNFFGRGFGFHLRLCNSGKKKFQMKTNVKIFVFVQFLNMDFIV